jgi:cytochrome c553
LADKAAIAVRGSDERFSECLGCDFGELRPGGRWFRGLPRDSGKIWFSWHRVDRGAFQTLRSTPSQPVNLNVKTEQLSSYPVGDIQVGADNRIVETPEDVEATEVLRDDRSSFIAYVPAGSIQKGQALVMTGEDGKTVRCTNCRGADLMGMDPIPGFAGRSPSYLVRQLYDMQHGFRTGEWTNQMTPVVAKLTADDMLAIATFLASRELGPK